MSDAKLAVKIKPNLLGLTSDELLTEAEKAVEEKELEKLKDIDVLLKRYFCKNTADQRFTRLGKFSERMAGFLSWFWWGGEPKWVEAVPIVNGWQTILELSQLITQAEPTKEAYKELKKSSYGVDLVTLLHDKMLMKPVEIKKSLGINTIQQVSNLLSRFEDVGIIVREVDGKNVWVSLAKQGVFVYQEFIEPKSNYISQLVISALKKYDKDELQQAKEELHQEIEENPRNSFAYCLLGIIDLVERKFQEAGPMLSKADKLGLPKEEPFLVFFHLESNKKLNPLKDRFCELNWQRDEISRNIKQSMGVYGLLNEYMGKTDRAIQCYRVKDIEF